MLFSDLSFTHWLPSAEQKNNYLLYIPCRAALCESCGNSVVAPVSLAYIWLFGMYVWRRSSLVTSDERIFLRMFVCRCLHLLLLFAPLPIGAICLGESKVQDIPRW